MANLGHSSTALKYHPWKWKQNLKQNDGTLLSARDSGACQMRRCVLWQIAPTFRQNVMSPFLGLKSSFTFIFRVKKMFFYPEYFTTGFSKTLYVRTALHGIISRNTIMFTATVMTSILTGFRKPQCLQAAKDRILLQHHVPRNSHSWEANNSSASE